MRVLWLSIGFALVGTACGGSDAPATTPPTTVAATTAAPTTTTLVQDVASDLAAAQGALLAASDIGAGWVAEPDEDTANDELAALTQQIVGQEPACAAIAGLGLESFDEVIPDAPAELDGPTLAAGLNEIEQGISVWPTSADVANTYATVVGLDLLSCYRVLVPPIFDASLEGIDAAVSSIRVDEYLIGVGDRSWGVEILLTISLPDEMTLDITLTTVAVSTGRVITDLRFTELGPPSIDIDAIAALALERVRSAFGEGSG